jgi:hypothetical protein
MVRAPIRFRAELRTSDVEPELPPDASGADDLDDLKFTDVSPSSSISL